MEKKIHFIGIGGIGTSALAQILKSEGHQISGSDMNSSEITEQLEKSGIKVWQGHNPDHITEQEVVIFSPAIPTDNPELVKAHELGLHCMSYPEALGELTKKYTTIAIAGTHGKSTTTAMTALILTDAGLDPTVVIGTKVKEFDDQNFRIGKSKYLIVEACEYRKSFAHLQADILVITNVEAEHLDYYKNEAGYKEAFREMINNLPSTTKIIINGNDENSLEVSSEAKAELIIWKKTKDLHPRVAGKFNIENATAAAHVAEQLGIDQNITKTSISEFKGTWRRMEYLKKVGETQFIDDYAHHPTEIRATLGAIREKYPNSKILCIFQPHQYSRTYELLDQFAESFAAVDEVLIPNIYRVRDTEEDVEKVSAKDLAHRIGKKAWDGHGMGESTQWLNDNYQKFDIVVAMGAGDVSKMIR